MRRLDRLYAAIWTRQVFSQVGTRSRAAGTIRSVKFRAQAAICIAAALALTGCSAGTHTSPPGTVRTTHPAGKPATNSASVGVPKRVIVHGGSAITVTLESVTYRRLPGAEDDGMTEYAVMKFTFTGDGPKPVTVGDADISLSEPGVGNPYNSEPNTDYTPYGIPLRTPTISAGQTVTGLVAIVISDDTGYRIALDDSSANADAIGHTVAVWKAHSASKPTS